jgi:multidrug efflux pump subunit AcrA (membrane-fusion protein)
VLKQGPMNLIPTLLFALCLFGLSTGEGRAAAAPPQVVIQKMAQEDVYDLFIYPVQIVANSLGAVLAESSGVVEELQVRIGDKVKKDQVIARIRQLDPVFRYRPLEVRATMSGIVSDLFVTQGTHVPQGERLFLITNPTDIRVNMQIATRDLNSIHVGLEGTMTIRGSDVEIPVRVRGISPLVDQATGTSTAELEVLDHDAQVPLGTIGRVEMRANKTSGHMLTQDALSYRGRQAYVRIAGADSTIESRQVTLGRKRSGRVEILEGLSDGELVVLRSSGFIRDGQAVSVSNPPAEE